jgi:hypothetical protein
MANRFSIVYYTFLSISPSCRIVLNLSKIALTPAGVISDKTYPHSVIKSAAISTESSVGLSKNNVNNSNANISCTTY